MEKLVVIEGGIWRKGIMSIGYGAWALEFGIWRGCTIWLEFLGLGFGYLVDGLERCELILE